MRLRDACVDLYDPRLLAHFMREHDTDAREHTVAASDDSEAFSQAGMPPAWLGLHRPCCRTTRRQRRRTADTPACTEDPCAVTSDSLNSTAAPRGLECRATSAIPGNNVADGDGERLASDGEPVDVGAASGAVRAECAALMSAAAAATAAPSAGALAALQLLQMAPRVQEAEVAGTALDLAAEGVKFAFADTGAVPGEHAALFFSAVSAAAAHAGGGGVDAAAWDEVAADPDVAAVDAGVEASGSEEVDLASIADVSEITAAKSEAHDAAVLEQARDPRRAKLKMQHRYQTYLEVCTPFSPLPHCGSKPFF